MPWLAAMVAFACGVLFALSRPEPLFPPPNLGPSPKEHNVGPILLPLTAASGLGRSCSPDFEPTGAWQPTRGQVERFERALARGPRPALQRYIRQYVGLVVNGRLVLCANASPADRHWADDWKAKVIAVDDGGRAYWRALFDPRTDQLVGFNTNGSS